MRPTVVVFEEAPGFVTISVGEDGAISVPMKYVEDLRMDLLRATEVNYPSFEYGRQQWAPYYDPEETL